MAASQLMLASLVPRSGPGEGNTWLSHPSQVGRLAVIAGKRSGTIWWTTGLIINLPLMRSVWRAGTGDLCATRNACSRLPFDDIVGREF